MLNTTFIFDGIKSTDMGLYNIQIDSGGISTPYISGQDILEDSSVGNHIPSFYGVKKKPLDFSLTFSILDNEFTVKKKMEVARWLMHDEYRPFQTTGYLGKIFNVIAINDIEFVNFGANKGYFKVTFRCDAPWAWSPAYIETYNLSNNSNKQIIEMENNSNVLRYYYPEIWIELKSDNTSVSLTNLSDGGREFRIDNLEQGEILYVNNQKGKRRVETNLINIYRLGNFNKNWLKLKQGKNLIEVEGECLIKTKSVFPLYI